MLRTVVAGVVSACLSNNNYSLVSFEGLGKERAELAELGLEDWETFGTAGREMEGASESEAAS